MSRLDAEHRASGCCALSPLNQQRKEFLGPPLVKELDFPHLTNGCCSCCQLLTYQTSTLGVYSFDPMAHVLVKNVPSGQKERTSTELA